MTATLPPTAEFNRPSDFGEFWSHPELAPPVASVMPDAEILVQPLTPAQQARRSRLRRAVAGVMVGLLAFTTLAACIYVVKSWSAGGSTESASPKPAKAVVDERAEKVVVDERAGLRPGASVPTAEAVANPPLSDADQALALARAPVATDATLQAWTRLATQLSPSDRHRSEQELSRWTVKGTRPVQEAARLELALLWRATARRAKAKTVLASLARTATDPLVKRYALASLSAG